MNWRLFGTDVNPKGVEWLKKNQMLLPPTLKANILTFWDTFEHIPNVDDIIRENDPEWIFVCMPVYLNEDHVFRSKHYRPGEHCWYFTEEGFREVMLQRGYRLYEMNCSEVVWGLREDILSFAFRKKL